MTAASEPTRADFLAAYREALEARHPDELPEHLNAHLSGVAALLERRQSSVTIDLACAKRATRAIGFATPATAGQLLRNLRQLPGDVRLKAPAGEAGEAAKALAARLRLLDTARDAMRYLDSMGTRTPSAALMARRLKLAVLSAEESGR